MNGREKYGLPLLFDDEESWLSFAGSLLDSAARLTGTHAGEASARPAASMMAAMVAGWVMRNRGRFDLTKEKEKKKRKM